MKRGPVIILEGLIGAGKTTFARTMAEVLGESTLLLLEPDEKNNDNPYLADYYKDPDRWAFPMQIHLLSLRLKRQLQAQWRSMDSGLPSILDRSFYGDTAFARLQLQRGHMDKREFDTYQTLYQTMTAQVLLPQFCVWLRTTPETSVRRIRKRMWDQTGRTPESAIDLEYLKGLNEEISHMIRVLDDSGVLLFDLDWNSDKTPEEVQEACERIVHTIRAYNPPDLFLDLHRRTT